VSRCEVRALRRHAVAQALRRWRADATFDSCAATRVRGFISLNVRRAARIIFFFAGYLSAVSLGVMKRCAYCSWAL